MRSSEPTGGSEVPGGVAGTARERGPLPARITPRWVRRVLFEARLAFEDEMERERRRALDREIERYWRARHP